MEQQLYNVSRLTQEIKDLLESSFPRLWVEGEMSNCKHHSSGHLYFTLKDEKSQISCAMWRSRTSRLLFRPVDGLQIILEGDLQVYQRGGNYQLIVQQMQPAGIGSLQMAFEQLKAKLHKEGLFDNKHKRPIPAYPNKIGVITSPTGAAIRDVVSVISRRLPNTEILIYPVRVQGEGASTEIAAAIENLNQYGIVDVLLLTRGGGSLEDLWAFNEEVVARAIFTSQIPLVSAVGHEVDYSIADFVADLRAPTPSAAAEMIVKSRNELQGQLNYYQEKSITLLLNKLKNYREKLANLKNHYAFRKPLDNIQQKMQRLDELHRSITFAIKHRLELKTHQLQHLQKQLCSMNPDKILKRGYSIVYKNGHVIKDISQIQGKDLVKVKLSNGQFLAEVQPSGEQNE